MEKVKKLWLNCVKVIIVCFTALIVSITLALVLKIINWGI